MPCDERESTYRFLDGSAFITRCSLREYASAPRPPRWQANSSEEKAGKEAGYRFLRDGFGVMLRGHAYISGVVKCQDYS